MTVGWGDVAVTETGALAACSCQSDTPIAWFGTEVGSLVELAEPGRDIRVCAAWGHVYAAMKGQDSGRCLVARDDGLTAVLGSTAGNQCVAMAPTFSGVVAVYVTSSTHWTQVHLTKDLEIAGSQDFPQPPELHPGTSQGFRDLSATGQPRWMDLERTITLLNGVVLVMWMQRGDWIIGQGLVSPAQVSAWNGKEMFTVWKGDTSFPPRIGVSDRGDVMAAIASSTAVFVPFAEFQPYTVTPPVTPPIEPPVVTPFARKIGVFPFFVNHPRYGTERVTPGHGEILNDHADYPRVVPSHIASHPVIADPTVAASVPDADLYAVFSDTRFDVTGDLAVAWHRRKPLVLYHDGPDYPTSWLDRLAGMDLPCVQAYLQPGESPSAAALRISNTVMALAPRCPSIALAWMSYTGSGAFPLANVLALQPLLVDIVRANPTIKLILPFAWARPSGCLEHPELAAWVNALVAASDGLPNLQPTPPINPPVEPPTKPPAKEKRVKVDLTIVSTSTIDLTEAPHQDGHGLVSLKTGAGKYKSLTPNGDWQADSDNAGAWERFYPDGSIYWAYREDSGKLFMVGPRVGVKVPYMV